MTINLLPQDQKPSTYAVRTASVFRKIATILLLFFLFGLLSIFGIFFFYNDSLQKSIKKQEDLRNQILSLQQTGQKIVLLADRIDKYNSIENSSQGNKKFSSLTQIVSYISEGISLKSVSISDDFLKISLYSDGLKSLSVFISKIGSLDGFSSIYLASLTYRPEEGYSAEFKFVP